MKVFVAGATGAVGKRLVPMLVQKGHDVIAMTRSQKKAEALRASGVQAVIADGLDREAIRKAILQSCPDAIVHQMTALESANDFKHFDRDFALTNRLRTEGTDLLIDAARAAGVRRFVAQSYGNWNYERTGTGLKSETDPFDPAPPAHQVQSLDAIRYLEQRVMGAKYLEGVVLRYANFYGPGTGFAPDGSIAQMVRKRMLPILGDGAGVWSFIHVDDVAAATIAALDGPAGIYNIVDNEPAPVSQWLPELAKVLGAKPPMHIPVWLGRLAVGDVGVSMMTQIRGTSNQKAKRDLHWSPRFPSFREGFRDVFSAADAKPNPEPYIAYSNAKE